MLQGRKINKIFATWNFINFEMKSRLLLYESTKIIDLV